jgi:Ca2+-binding RTX toxin-like protein
MYFGSWGANNNYRFSGSMDEVKVYDGVLSNGEINELHDIESANIKWDATTLTTDEDAALVIDPASLLANDTDIDGDTIIIASVQDAQNGEVEIDVDGNVVFTPSENYNGEASFTYTIDDGNGNTDTATATLDVVSVEDAPTQITMTGGNIDENSFAGTVVARLGAVDGDAGETFSYTLVGDDSDKFEISGDQIVLKEGAELDFEAAESHEVSVQVTDSTGNIYTENLTINVNDVSEQNVYQVGDGNRYHNITSDLSGENLTGYTEVVGNASNDTIIGNDAVTSYDGGSGNDTITATSQDDSVTGGTGWDTLNGGAGDDTFHVSGTGDGQDTVSGGAGNDTIVGSDGDDTIGLKNFSGENRVENIDGGEGVNTIQVGDNNRYHATTSDFSETNLENIDSIVGTDSKDTIIGNDAVTNYDGGRYNDNITGGSGDDTIVGGHGNDILAGGAGDDVLIGGAGNDTATGGEGNDTYVMNPFDGSDYFAGGEGGGWIDVINVSEIIASDPDTPWTVEVNGASLEYDIAAGALELNPDTAGVISFGDGTELSFEGVERIEW